MAVKVEFPQILLPDPPRELGGGLKGSRALFTLLSSLLPLPLDKSQMETQLSAPEVQTEVNQGTCPCVPYLLGTWLLLAQMRMGTRLENLVCSQSPTISPSAEFDMGLLWMGP
jgi:hypothetical protein